MRLLQYLRESVSLLFASSPLPLAFVGSLEPPWACVEDARSSADATPHPPRAAIRSCYSCSRSGHDYCMQLDGVIQERIQTYEWQCLECKQCEICGRTEDLEVSLPAAPRLSLEQELTFS